MAAITTNDEGEAIVSTNPMVDDSAAEALAKKAAEEVDRRDLSLDKFLADIPKAKAADVRKETKAFLGDLRTAAGALSKAIVHLWNVKQVLSDIEGSNPEKLFSDYGKALVAEGHITGGTFYTFSKKIEVFQNLKAEDETPLLPESARTAIMAHSNGDSIIVRRALTQDEIATWKKENPATKAPKGVYEASKYFLRAVETIEAPAKWTAESADNFAGRVVRLAGALRGKDRSNPAERGDDSKMTRFTSAVDKVEVMLIGEPKEDGTGVKGMIVLADKQVEAEMISEGAETVCLAAIKRLPLADLESLWETLDEAFTAAKDKLTKAEEKRTGKAGKAA